jgi:hypothetical protein
MPLGIWNKSCRGLCLPIFTRLQILDVGGAKIKTILKICHAKLIIAFKTELFLKIFKSKWAKKMCPEQFQAPPRRFIPLYRSYLHTQVKNLKAIVYLGRDHSVQILMSNLCNSYLAWFLKPASFSHIYNG